LIILALLSLSENPLEFFSPVSCPDIKNNSPEMVRTSTILELTNYGCISWTWLLWKQSKAQGFEKKHKYLGG
jgi:hypothetical protein